MKVLHVITGLRPGGAELTLAKLVGALDQTSHHSTVVSLGRSGPVGDAIAALGVPVVALGGRAGVPEPRLVTRLRRLIDDLSPDVVQTWLYHADLVGGLAARWSGVPVVWGVHQDCPDPRRTKRRTLAVARMCAYLSSRVPATIVCCSPVARDGHVQLGYDAKRMVVVPNGFDLDRFRPDAAAGARLRSELGLAPTTRLVGLYARLDPLKDHATFLAAAATMARADSNVHFVLAGDGVETGAEALAACDHDPDLRGRCTLLGRRSDMPELTAALDVAVSASRREGFSNTIAEAMACEVPVVATDVGYAAKLLDGYGALVPAGDADALATAMLRTLALDPAERQRLGSAARVSLAARFSISAMADGYMAAWSSVTGGQPASASVNPAVVVAR